MRSFAFRQIFEIRDRNERSPPRSSEIISNSTSDDPSKSTCFKERLETVSPSESAELQRKERSREGFWELAALQGAEVGLRMLQIPRVFSRQNRDREPFATEWWGKERYWKLTFSRASQRIPARSGVLDGVSPPFGKRQQNQLFLSVR
jgi:hypothetical protein